jgi:hypothetical protein
VIFCLPLLQNLVFRLSFSFRNLVFLFCLCNCFGISSSLQFLQFGIYVQFLRKKIWSDILSSASTKSGISTFLQLLQFDISVLSLKLFWYFVFSSVSAIWYLRSVSANFFGMIFYLPLLQNLVFRLFLNFCHGIYYQRDCLVTLVTC